MAAGRRKWAAPGLVLQTLRRDRTGGPDGEPGTVPIPGVRVGFTVSRKVGCAVERNRVRRRLRAAVDRVFADHARPGTDYVVIGRRQALARDFTDLVTDLETAMRRLDAFVPAGEPRS
ncbi:MAG: ribonuclease P protein component [Alphaproteobacteria bacterium]